MLGRIWAGGHYCNGTPEYRKRRKQVERREVLIEIEDEAPAFFDERDLAVIAMYEDDPSISD